MHKLRFLLFLLPLTSNAQLYISPIIGIDGLHLSLTQKIPKSISVEEVYSINYPSFGMNVIYAWNNVSVSYLTVFLKKRYDLYLGYQFKIFDKKWLNKKGQKCPKF